MYMNSLVMALLAAACATAAPIVQPKALFALEGLEGVDSRSTNINPKALFALAERNTENPKALFALAGPELTERTTENPKALFALAGPELTERNTENPKALFLAGPEVAVE